MTISSQTSRISYVGNGSTTAFSIPFYFAANADIIVYLTSATGTQTIQVLGTHYTLTGATVAAGGTATFITAPTATTGATIAIYRDPALTQTTSYNNNDPFPAKSHELALDKALTIEQRTRDIATRAIHQPDGEAAMTTTLDTVANRKNKLFGFGTSGELIYPLGPTYVGTTSTGAAEVDSRATAQVTTFAVSVNTIRTGGYATPGDGGGAIYKRVVSQPSHAGKFQSADGAWWEIAEPVISFANLGCFTGSTNSDTAADNAIATAVALSRPLLIAGGVYDFAKQKAFTSVSKVILDGNVDFGFESGALSAVDFPNLCFVYVGGPALEAFGSLGANADLGSAAITLDGSHTPSAGDYLVIWNPTAGSFNAADASYLAGEVVKVAVVSGAVAYLNDTLAAAYTTVAVTMYRLAKRKIAFVGGTLTIRENTAVAFDSHAGFRAIRITDSDFSAIRPTNSGYGGIRLDQCHYTVGSGYVVQNLRRTSSGESYGVVLSGCQGCVMQGNFDGAKHAFAQGGDGTTGSIPCRYNKISGNFRNSHYATGVLGAVNWHGNCEYCTYDGVFDGGILAGGNHNIARGQAIARSDKNGTAISIIQLLGYDFDFSGMHVRSYGNPNTDSLAVIEIGANGEGPTVNTLYGGTIKLDGMTVDAPDATRILTYTNRGCVTAEATAISMQGFTLERAAGGFIAIVSKVSGSDLGRIDLDGIKNKPSAAYSIVAATKVRGWSDKGTLAITPDTGASTTAAAITFNHPAPRTPRGTITLESVVPGGKRGYSAYSQNSTTAAIATIATADAANFASATQVQANWSVWVNDA